MREIFRRLALLALLLGPAAPGMVAAEDGQDGVRQVDELELDASSVTGNRELPRVLYIVPWKETGIGEIEGRPLDSLLDEVLAPVDREVFVREVKYFDQLYGQVESSAVE